MEQIQPFLSEIFPHFYFHWQVSACFCSSVQKEAEKIQIHLPKFKFEYKNKLNNELKNMDMGIAFDPFNADFSKINPNLQLFISKVIHKTFIEVNEEGTEAAAVTMVEIGITSAGGETFIPFYVNQPFIFAIKEKYTNAIIFIGKVMEPEYED